MASLGDTGPSQIGVSHSDCLSAVLLTVTEPMRDCTLIGCLALVNQCEKQKGEKVKQKMSKQHILYRHDTIIDRCKTALILNTPIKYLY